MNENIESCQREKRTYDEEGVREAVRLFLKSIGEGVSIFPSHLNTDWISTFPHS